MLSGPTQGADNTKQASLFQKILFGIICFVGFVIFCSLFSFKSTSDDAMNGELLTNAAVNSVVPAAHGSFVSGLFEYFGNVTFLFPFIAVFIFYRLIFSFASLNYKKINFFLVGICILGLDTMVLGLCPIFDHLAADDSTAGGLLGEFFNQYFFNHLPSPASGLLPLFISFVGLMLFTNKGPLWYCDAIGHLFTKYVLRRKDNPSQEPQEEEENAKENTELEKTPVQTTISVFDNPPHLDIEKKVAEEANTPHKERVIPNLGTFGKHEPSFGDSSRNGPVNFLKGQSSLHGSTFGVRPQVAFGAGSQLPVFGSPRPQEKTAQAPISVFGRNNHKTPIAKRIEPEFGDISLLESSVAVGAPKVEESKPLYISPGVHTSDNKSSQASSTSVSGKTESQSDSGPRTFITGSSVFAPKAPEIKAENNNESKTIIRDSRIQDVQESPKVTVQKTIITTSVVSGSSSVAAGTFDNKAPAEPKTIVYKSGASHIPPVESVGSPMRHSEVSTVITRTTKTPVDKVNPISAMSAGRLEGSYHEDSSEKQDSLKSYDNSYGSDGSQSMFPSPEEMEENVISFTDFIAREKQNHEINVSNLTSAFIPSASATEGSSLPQSAPADNRLEKVQSEPIKESDAAFEQYSRGTRGVVNSYENTASAQVVPAATITGTYGQTSQSTLFNSSAHEGSSFDQKDSMAGNSIRTESASGFGGISQSSAGSYVNSQNNYASDNQNSGRESASGRSEDLPVDYTEKVPFDDISSISGGVPYGMTVEPSKNPITQMPTKAYARSTETTPSRVFSSWRPSIDLLARSKDESFDNSEEIADKTRIINKAMQDFKVRTQVVQNTAGPVITRFDVRLESGVRSKEIKNISTDLQRILMSGKLNVIEAVAGTPYVGIEVPNRHRKLITLGDIAECVTYSDAKLPMCLGVDTVGNPIVADLATAPHLLIAGTTGSGKSAGVNSMMVSLLLKRSPDELRLIMVDPKTVEFTQYQNLPHLLTPIITDPFSALAAVSWLVSEMERRYKLLTSLRVPNIGECNELIRRENAKGNKVYDPAWSADMGGEPPVLKPVPYIVLVIDEFADLMAVSSGAKKGEKSLDGLISRIVAKARAAGIHFILATQSPRAEVVTGVIKANMPAKIAYTVQSAMDSRIILDDTGAENLLGNGDMIARFQKINNNELFRAHGPYSSTADVQAVVRAWIDEAGDPEYVEGVTDIEDETEVEEDRGSDNNGSSSRDEKFDAIVAYAREFCGASGKALSVSEIQTEFSLGWNRAKRVHKQLKTEGIIDEKGYLI